MAWTLNASDGILSSLPIGTASWPISHHDRIWLAYWKVLNAAQQTAGGSLGLNLFSPLVELRIDPAREINAFVFGGNYIHVNLALSQLISDSPSELGFVVGHEIGHRIRARLGNRPLFHANPELDADAYGMLFNLVAGYDPYAGAVWRILHGLQRPDSSQLSRGRAHGRATTPHGLPGATSGRDVPPPHATLRLYP